MKYNSSILSLRFVGKFILPVVGVALLAAPWILEAQSPINVTTIIHDDSTSTSGADLTLRSDDVNPPSDDRFAGTYVTTTCGKGKCTDMTSAVSSGGWSLLLYNQSTRTVHLHFVSCSFQPSNPAICAPDGKIPAVNDGNFSANVEMYVHCLDGANQKIDFLSISPGTSYNRCELGLDFSDSKNKYKLEMGQYIASQGNNQAKTGWAAATCTTPVASPMPPCNSWTITPYLGADAGNYPMAAALYQYARNGSLSFVGSYIDTFRIDMKYP